MAPISLKQFTTSAVLLIGVLGWAASVHAQAIDLAQGWSKADSEKFWFGSQGSRIMRESWFLNIEQKGSTAENIRLLSDKRFLRKLGFIAVDGYALPIGFAVDRNQSGTSYIGLTCS